MQSLDFIFSVAILLMSVVIHEVSHGFAANFLGDPTARLAGRLTLNPLKHLDPVGSVIVPIITSITGFTFGWAKPVPYNPYNLKNRRWGELAVAFEGPFSNISLALIFGLLMRYGILGEFLPFSFVKILASVVLINLVLAVFNLVPLPPLDGSKLLFAVLPLHASIKFREFTEKYGFFLVVIFIIFFWGVVSDIVAVLFNLITGLAA